MNDDDDDDDLDFESPMHKKSDASSNSIFVLSSDDEDLPSFSKILKESNDFGLSSEEEESKSTEIADINETESIIMSHALEMSTCDKVEDKRYIDNVL